MCYCFLEDMECTYCCFFDPFVWLSYVMHIFLIASNFFTLDDPTRKNCSRPAHNLGYKIAYNPAHKQAHNPAYNLAHNPAHNLAHKSVTLCIFAFATILTTPNHTVLNPLLGRFCAVC